MLQRCRRFVVFPTKKTKSTFMCKSKLDTEIRSANMHCNVQSVPFILNQNKISVSTLTSVLLCLYILSTKSVSCLRKTHLCIKHTVFTTHATSCFWRQHVYLSSCPCQSVSAAASNIFSLVKTWHVTKMHHTH